jgi:intracellular sulfur oxidation DsrE/DsrF family protein
MSTLQGPGGTPRPSDELLNSFVDDQLAREEKGRLFVQVAQDENLSREVCELRKLHELVQFAYRDPPGAPRGDASGGRASLNIAAGLALMVGLALGWFLHQETPGDAARRMATAEAEKPLKVLLHIADDDTMRLAQALDEVESVLAQFRRTGQNARLEVIINGNGLALVREDVTPFADRIQQIQKTYDNVAFLACQNTIDRLRHDTGIVARLLPGVTVIDSGVAQLMRRQQQGWAYIQG